MKPTPFFPLCPPLCALALFALTGSDSLGAANEWPQFRGPTGQGQSSATNLPLEWNATTNVVWKVEVPGSGWSSPVLAKGRIYLTAAVPDAASGDITLRALCFDEKNGGVVWDTEVFRPDPGSATKMHKKNTAASPTPIVTADRLFVHFGHMGTAAKTRVLIDSTHGPDTWSTVGVSYNIIDASWRALTDSVEYFLAE